MPDQELIRRWLAASPDLPELETEHTADVLASRASRFVQLQSSTPST